MAIVKNSKLYGRPKTLAAAKAEDQPITKADINNDVKLVQVFGEPSKENVDTEPLPKKDVETWKKIIEEAGADKDFAIKTHDSVNVEKSNLDVDIEITKAIDAGRIQPKRKAGRPPKKGKK